MAASRETAGLQSFTQKQQLLQPCELALRRAAPIRRAPRELIDGPEWSGYDFLWGICANWSSWMRLSILRCFLCWTMLVSVPVSLLGKTELGQTGLNQTPPGPSGQDQAAPSASAILHTQGGVWVNGYEAKDSSAVFPGDVVETKPGSPATLNLDGATILVQPESVAKLQSNLLELDHGGVAVGTSKGFKVKVKCLTATPVSNEWTQYEVSDVNGNIQVAARKNDVNVERESDGKKPLPATATESPHGTTVHEGEQKSFNESELCGAAAPIKGTNMSVNPKWVAAGAAGTGIILCVLLCHGGPSKTPVSSSTP